MNVGPEDLQKIGDYVRLHMPEWMRGFRNDRENRSHRMYCEGRRKAQIPAGTYEAGFLYNGKKNADSAVHNGLKVYPDRCTHGSF